MAEGLKTQSRNLNFDLLRIIAVLGVITLHQSFDGNHHEATVSRLAFRWCVPFFFMLTGFYLSEAVGLPKIGLERIRRLLGIIIAANLLYFPISLSVNGLQSVTLGSLLVGSWFHLWFLSSLLLAYLLMVAADSWGSPKLLSVCAAVAVIGVVLADILTMIDRARFDQMFVTLRHISGFGFVYLGYAVARAQIRMSTSRAVFMTVAGFALIIAETGYLAALGLPQIDRQMPLGAIVVAVGLLFWCRYAKVEFAHFECVSRLGKDHSLNAYILHPIFLKVADIAMAVTGVEVAKPYIGIAIAFAGSLVASVILVNLRRSAFTTS